MSKKDYKKGMFDAIEAYEGFGKKQEAATEYVAGEVAKVAGKMDKLGDKIGEIKDYITDKEKAALYKLNTPVDIAALESSEKRVLLAVLYQLSADEEELTEEQQNYVRAVQQYLKIYNPQTEIDLEAVENIEDIATQKAVLQTVLEFFYLGAHPGTYSEDQLEFLDCFQVNRKTRREISDHIKAIVETVGVQGLAEKYGFVPKPDEANTEASKFAEVDTTALTQKLLSLYSESAGITIKCITANYIIFEKWGVFRGDRKTCRLDIRTLEQTLLQNPDYVPSGIGRVVVQDEIIDNMPKEEGDAIIAYDVAHSSSTTLTTCEKNSVRGLRASEEYILFQQDGGYRFLSRADENNGFLESTADRRWENLVKDKLYCVNAKNYNLCTDGVLELYDLKTKEIKTLGVVPWNFAPFAVCGEKIFGYVPDILSKRSVCVFDCTTQKISTLLRYDKSNFEECWCTQFGEHKILIGNSGSDNDDSVDVYDLNLESAEVQILVHLENTENIDIIGPIGSRFYYAETIYSSDESEEGSKTQHKIHQVPFGA